jgi:hypothetical protein
MKDCFGLQMGVGPEGLAPSEEMVRACYECEDFDKCYKYSLIRALVTIKHEMRLGSEGIRKSLRGSHSDNPLW